MNIYSCTSIIYLLISFLFLQSCAAIATYPTSARVGDTVSVMIGGSEKASKDSISVQLADSNGAIWNLNDLGAVRSVFNLRPDPLSTGLNYSSYLEKLVSWNQAHEPVQTVLVVDIPQGVALGNASLMVNHFASDDSSGVSNPASYDIEIIPGAGSSDNFERQDFLGGVYPVDFSRLEKAPYAKVSFGTQGNIFIGACSLIVDFDETVVDASEINVYVPESTVKGSISNPGSFGENQRMLYWRQNAGQLYIDVIAPQGLNHTYLLIYIIHPPNLAASPNFSIISQECFDVDGQNLSVAPLMEYFP